MSVRCRRRHLFGPITLGSITINWVAPLTLADGTAVSGLTGYKVYWSTVPYDPAPPNSAAVSGAGTLTYTIPNLASGTYYVWVASVTAGGESDREPAYQGDRATGSPSWSV